MEAVAVYWEDSVHIEYGWHEYSPFEPYGDEHIICVSTGILLEDTDLYIVIAQSANYECSVVSNTLKIPKRSVLKVIKMQKLSEIFFSKKGKENK